MHELPRTRPAVRRKWVYNSNDLTFLLRRVTPICVASTSVSAISQTSWNTGTVSKYCLAGWNWYGCILAGLSGKVSVSSSELELAILHDSPEWRSRHMVTWFGRRGDAFGTTENAFFRPFITLRSQFHLHHCSQRAGFNGNRIKNHP